MFREAKHCLNLKNDQVSNYEKKSVAEVQIQNHYGQKGGFLLLSSASVAPKY